jgi:hypothetical protein
MTFIGTLTFIGTDRIYVLKTVSTFFLDLRDFPVMNPVPEGPWQ